jgi:hypothetical protein
MRKMAKNRVQYVSVSMGGVRGCKKVLAVTKNTQFSEKSLNQATSNLPS